MKRYLNIKEVSKILDIKEHVIRYWDSIDPKTSKIRIEGISTKSKGGTRYFNKDNISKLQKLKNILYENGDQMHTLKIANKFISLNKRKIINDKNQVFEKDFLNPQNTEKFHQILKNMRKLLK